MIPNITWIALCECGAVTITIDNSDYSMPKEMFEKKSGSLEDALENTPKQNEVQKFFNCNYCVNGWGIDLCACGSGEKVGECDNDLDDCGQSMQILETGQTNFKADDSWL